MPNLDDKTAGIPLGFVRTGDSTYRANGAGSAFVVPANGGKQKIAAMPSGTVAVLVSVASSVYYTVGGESPTSGSCYVWTGGGSDERIWPYNGFADSMLFMSTTGSGVVGYVTPLKVG
jgi:hypothetical protein